MIKNDIKKNILSSNLKINLKLRKEQLSEREKREIDGKRLDKIGVAKLDFKENINRDKLKL
jgi:hypothetical protein